MRFKTVVILWNPNDYDHVLFVTLSQLIPCYSLFEADERGSVVNDCLLEGDQEQGHQQVLM